MNGIFVDFFSSIKISSTILLNLIFLNLSEIIHLPCKIYQRKDACWGDTVDKQKDFLLLSSAEQDTQDTSRCFHFYVQNNLRISSFMQRLFFFKHISDLETRKQKQLIQPMFESRPEFLEVGCICLLHYRACQTDQLVVLLHRKGNTCFSKIKFLVTFCLELHPLTYMQFVNI